MQWSFSASASEAQPNVLSARGDGPTGWSHDWQRQVINNQHKRVGLKTGVSPIPPNPGEVSRIADSVACASTHIDPGCRGGAPAGPAATSQRSHSWMLNPPRGCRTAILLLYMALEPQSGFQTATNPIIRVRCDGNCGLASGGGLGHQSARHPSVTHPIVSRET